MKKLLVITLIFMLSVVSSANAQGKTIVMMHLDKTPVTDECGSTWKTEGSPVISDVNPKTSAVSPRPMLQLDGESYLQKEDGIILGGKDFTIDGWVYIDSICGNWARVFDFNTKEGGEDNRIVLCRNGRGPCFAVNGTLKDIAGHIDEFFHFACVYEHEKNIVSFYINGELKDMIEIKIPARKFSLAYIGRSSSKDPMFTGAICEFRVTEGSALWTENFMPESINITSSVPDTPTITCPYCGSPLRITIEKSK